ncbi:hypothetical protein FPQ18DRAFT_253291 [Pyronema domesticum]|uniref:Similar to UPF0394 membrane protein PD_1892 acc. no. Q87AD4 n=1 Tax=Pyronema omphalodes (strain CBS 100304) TaxID=1076935 RepID=U4LD64_PYROM|nr:hypothetical protein FPQ18DRAFT_253291 [Pyronema domesticum]CCX08488.1 Similar to UPF0394 membrane protein PD_1892; acc. no. Q87AD4 [Pyronema omphalodes CBS 100304]
MFTPVTTSLGAALLHISSSTLLLTNSQILGCSSLLSSLVNPSWSTTPTLIGLLASPLAIKLLLPSHLPQYLETPWITTITAGLLVGLGTKLAKGCTSGHMLMGLSRGSIRSLVATATFFSAAVATAYLTDSPPSCAGGPCYTPTFPAAQGAIAVVAASAIGAWVIRNKLQVSERSRVIARGFCGFVFGLGLLISGMAAPAKTLGFMSIFDLERFDPSLMAVAIIGIGGNALAWFTREDGPKLKEGEWEVPSGEVEAKLVVGSLLFGIGWGMAGVCPGPAAVAAVLNGWKGLGWLAAFLIGQVVAGKAVEMSEEKKL